MSKIQDELIERYAEEKQILRFSYEMMKKLMDKKYISGRIKLFNIDELYIYGGGFLGLQLYYYAKDMFNVKAIVDINGKSVVNNEDIKNVITPDRLKEIYKNEKVIITPIQYYKQIFSDLSAFIPKENILNLGEFIEGMV